MNRVIKFRGKSKRDGKWFYGNLFDKDINGRTHVGTTTRCCLDIDPETVGQFTGLHDKNGKEIYEGDIMNGPKGEDVGVVEWNSILCQFHLLWQNRHTVSDLFMVNNGSLIIGNIHDNPELLTNLH